MKVKVKRTIYVLHTISVLLSIYYLHLHLFSLIMPHFSIINLLLQDSQKTNQDIVTFCWFLLWISFMHPQWRLGHTYPQALTKNEQQQEDLIHRPCPSRKSASQWWQYRSLYYFHSSLQVHKWRTDSLYCSPALFKVQNLKGFRLSPLLIRQLRDLRHRGNLG